MESLLVLLGYVGHPVLLTVSSDREISYGRMHLALGLALVYEYAPNAKQKTMFLEVVASP